MCREVFLAQNSAFNSRSGNNIVGAGVNLSSAKAELFRKDVSVQMTLTVKAEMVSICKACRRILMATSCGVGIELRKLYRIWISK